ncbi:MAG: Fe-S protein [Candidatus Omnitrophica bacterium]|nr:Fe-S protein [Candidatus Omnitrophota bacterium]
MMKILTAGLVVGSLGLLFGLLLAVASKKFSLDVDPRVEKIIALLPGVNCGVCGKPGCKEFARALIKDEISLDACRASSRKKKAEIANILGMKK